MKESVPPAMQAALNLLLEAFPNSAIVICVEAPIHDELSDSFCLHNLSSDDFPKVLRQFIQDARDHEDDVSGTGNPS